MSASSTIPYDTNVSNFVSVKLSGKQNYLLWKAQMLCLLESVNVCGILDNTFVGPRDSGAETVRQYDNLVKGWIFSSVSEAVLEEVYDLRSAKDVWEKLQSNYDPAKFLQEEKEDPIIAQLILGEDTVPTEMEKMKKTANKLKLRSHIIKDDWPKLESMLKEDKGLASEAISSDGSTVLHIAVGMRRNRIVKRLLFKVLKKDKEQSLKKRHDGSTALHIAAIVGNTYAACYLVFLNESLLVTEDDNGDRPLQKAYENMHLDTIAYLLYAFERHYPKSLSIRPDDKFAVDLLVKAISVKRYSLASEFLEKFPKAASTSDHVLMALAKTFPSGLDNREKLFYPSLKSTLEMLRKTTFVTVRLFATPAIIAPQIYAKCCASSGDFRKILYMLIYVISIVPFSMLTSATTFICLIGLIICFPFHLLYYLLWKGTFILKFPPIKKIEIKVIEEEEAKKILVQICDEIDKLNYPGTPHPCYSGPILEAACQNACAVVEEILSRLPIAIQSKDENEYDIIQLAIMNRSEKIYNLINDIDERIYSYRIFKDTSKNNILHLAGRLAPSSVLNQRIGAALQIQHELQWYEEVKKFVFPTYITQKNIFKETPDMVFTREHARLLKEGEQWMKTTAESGSIAASIITTIVFAAAITVPGGNNQDKGTPLLNREPAFIIFAISDAISLFASSTSLLVFFAMLTTRFAEKDFLVLLPWRLFIGLFSLLLSITTMMVAFSATLFLVFCDQKLWMLAPICGLALIPIAIFVGQQFPLMVDLYSSIYIPIFGKERKVNFKNLIRKIYKDLHD